MNVKDLKGKTIAFAASGGLDSCTITRWLTDNGVSVTCFTADLGQVDENMEIIRERMLACGAGDVVILDAKKSLANAGLDIIRSQACYEDRYWNTAGIARYIIVQSMIPEMGKRNISILSHGATGRGNDQVRFQLATNMLAPEFHVYAPWRDELFLSTFGGRDNMIEYCMERKLPITASKDSPYSTDANLLGLTHEAGKLESLQTAAHFVTPEMGNYPSKAPEKADDFIIRFEKGVPVRVNGEEVDTLKALTIANELGGQHGIGIGVHMVENRFVGIKSRGIYENPGMELMGTCYGLLLQLILDRRAREFFDQLSLTISKQIYQGYWFDLCTTIALSAVRETAQLATGTIHVSLYRGNIIFISAEDAPHSLYSEDNASMEAIGEYDHSDSEGLLRVLGISAKALKQAGQIRE